MTTATTGEIDMALNVYLRNTEGQNLYTSTISASLKSMAEELCIGCLIWYPRDYFDKKEILAKELIHRLEIGITELALNPSYYGQLQLTGREGSWEDLLLFCIRYMQACKDFPNAIVKTDHS